MSTTYMNITQESFIYFLKKKKENTKILLLLFVVVIARFGFSSSFR